jgi:hypothetical protein
MPQPDVIEEFTRMAQIDSEIASPVNYLRPEIRASGKSTPLAMEFEKVATVTWAPVPSNLSPGAPQKPHKFLLLFSLYISFVVAATPILLITSSLRISP